MRSILIIDTETTGLEPKRDWLLEIGLVLYSLENKSIMAQLSYLLNVPDNPSEHINNIPLGAARQFCNYGFSEYYDNTAKKMIESADVFVAHNADFDKKWMEILDPIWLTKPWICTLNDVSWPAIPAGGLSLVNLALHYGMAVFDNHRALPDCNLLAGIFKREPNTKELLTRALEPKKLYFAPCIYDNFKLRDEIKSHGFKWNPESKQWQKKLTMEEFKKVPFKLVEIN